jgi:hypothetical protein
MAILPRVPFTAMPIADPDDPSNIRAGIIHRIGRDKPGVTQETMDALRAHVRNMCDSLFGCVEPTILSFEEWIEGTQYTLRRKETFRKLHADHGDAPDLASSSIVKAFIKRERFNKYKNPRIIASRDTPFKAYSGPFFKSLENMIFENPRFIKHVPVPERAEHVMQHLGPVPPGWHIYVNDHTSFETHAHTTMDALEFEVYRKYLPREFVQVAERVLLGNQRILFKGGSATLRSRMSGEMNTSLGNGLANLLSVLCVVRQHYGEEWRQVRTIIEGDDGIFVTPPNVVLTEDMFRQFGFVVVLDEVVSLGKAGFCSTYFTEDGKHAIVEPMKCILGIGWSIKANRHSPKHYISDLQKSKALSAYHEYPGVPVLSVLGERLLAHYGSTNRPISEDWYENQLFEWIAQNPGGRDRTITYDSRVLFENTFSWPIADQLAVEQHIMHSPIDSIFDHDVFHSRVDPIYRDCYFRYVSEYFPTSTIQQEQCPERTTTKTRTTTDAATRPQASL